MCKGRAWQVQKGSQRKEKAQKSCAEGTDGCMGIPGHPEAKVPLGVRRGHHNYSHPGSLNCAYHLDTTLFQHRSGLNLYLGMVCVFQA